MALEAVAETALLALELPFFQKPVRYQVVMNRKKEVGHRVVGLRHPPDQSLHGPTIRDQQGGLAEAGIDQALLDLLCEGKVEFIFGEATGAFGSRHLERVPDIHDDAKSRAVAGRLARLDRGSGGCLGPRDFRPARSKQRGEDCKQNRFEA